MKEGLTNSQIVILRSIFKRSGGCPVVTDSPWQKEFLPTLSRRGLIEIWYKQIMLIRLSHTNAETTRYGYHRSFL